MTRRLSQFFDWIDWILAGPTPAPRACEYRRPASITCIRHGQRKRPRHA